MSGLLELVPNVSEGRRADVVKEIAHAFASGGATLLGYESDPAHHRSVITLVGAPDEVVEGAVRGTIAARDRIDLRGHRGEHPRMGAADVVPFVPLAGATMADAVRAAERAAERIAKEAGIPTYLYGDAARRPERRDLASVRRGEFEGISAEVATNPDRAPDFGPRALHPTAGASAVGARFFLVAFNVDLATRDLALAKRIAKEIRERDGGLPAVKALGFDLPDRGWVQVSMNLVDYRRTSPLAAYEAIARRAKEAGVEVAGSEVVGLIPEAAMGPGFAKAVRLMDFDPDEQVLERLLATRRGAAMTPLAVLFDLDGVLIDSFGAWVAAVNDVARRFGVGPFSREHVAEIWGQGVAADAKSLYPGRSHDEIRAAYQDALPRHVEAVAVNPEATAVLGALRSAGIARAVVTNTQDSLADAIVVAKGLRPFVDTVAALRPGVREKPAPDLLHAALATLRVPAAEAWMIGDTRYDEDAARAAGVRFVRYDLAKGERLAEALRPLLDGAARRA